MPECNVDGCTREAIVKLLGAGTYHKPGYRCLPCLEADLDDVQLTNHADTPSFSHAQ